MIDPSTRQISYGVLAVAVLVGALVVAWFVRDATTDDASFNNPRLVAAEPVGGPAEVTPDWCVQSVNVDEHFQALAKKSVEELLPEFRRFEESLRGYGDAMPDTVHSGCPIGPAIYDEKACPPPAVITQLLHTCNGRRVDEFGRYDVLIYALPETEIERLAGGPVNSRLTGEDVKWEGDVGFGGSVGWFLSPAELQEPSFLRYWLYELAGLPDCRPADAQLPGLVPAWCKVGE